MKNWCKVSGAFIGIFYFIFAEASSAEISKWKEDSMFSRPTFPHTYQSVASMSLSVVNAKKSFDVEQQLANEHLPVKSDLSWDLIVNEVDERIAETKLYPRDGIEWTFSVYTQLENSVPYYWIGSGYDAFCGDDVFCAAEEFVKAEICGHTPNARVSIATNILERGEIKFLKLGGESVEIPFDRTIFLFVDDKPGANWSHPCRYVFLNETLTEFVVYYQMNPPRIFDLSSDQRIRLKCCNGESSPYQTLEQIQNSVYSSAAAMASNALSYSGDVSKSYFVLISGGMDPESNGIRFWADTAMMYSTLTLKYGVPKSHIYVYVSDGTSSAKDANLYDETNPVLVSSPTDLDGDGQSDVDGAATKSNVSSIFSTLRGQLTSSDQLFVFITSHGSPDGVAGASNYGCLAWLFSTSGLAYFYDTDLHDWTKGFSCPVAFAIETCYSGGFIDDIRQTANRVIATACNHYENSFGTTYVSESWGSGGAGQIRAYNNWAMPFISAIRGYIPKSAYTPDTYPWQDGISCDADNNRDGYISFSEAKAYALSNDSSAIGGNEHPQYAESTSGLGASFFLVKKPAVVSPVNNNFASATAISGSSGSTTGSNVGATAESSEPLLSYKSSATTTVWWKWTAPSSGKAKFDTIGSGLDTVMGVYTGSSLSSLTKAAPEDDDGAGSGSASKCEFDCTSGTRYYIVVAGYGGNTGTIKLNWNLTPQVVAPSTPTGVSATDGSYTDYARVTWSAASGATSYNLYRSTTTSRPSTATKTGVTSPYNDTTATPGTKYYYWIAAVNSAGSSVSSYDTGYRAVSLTLGKSSDSYGASSGSGSASVTANTSWSASANVDWITFGTKSGSGNGTLTYTVAANTSTSSRTGTITVTAGSGTSYPATRTITVSQAMGAPSAPTGVSATDGSYADYARVTWSAASGATSYNLYRSTTTSRPSTATKTGVTSPYNDTTATPGTKYYYWIAAVNSAGSSVSSYDTGYRAVSLTLDKSSDSYTASGGSGSASVTANTSWSASANVDWITFGTKSGSGNGTLTYTVAANTLTSSRTGTITVMAGSGTSYPMTRTITVSQEMFTIAAPTSVSATDGLSTDYVRVTWSAVNGATSYNIYRSITQSDHTLLATNVTSPYNDTTAIPGAKYYYRVASVYSINAHISSSYDTGYRRVSLSLDKSADSYVASGGSGSVFITANTTWKVSTDVGWITFGTNYASSSGTLTYTVAANTSFTSRTGTITVTAGFGMEYPETKTITVTQAMRLPDTPTSMLASDGLYTDYAQVTWSAVSGATSYNLYRSTTTSRPSTPFAKNVTSPYNDTTATPGTKYYYWIAAVNSAGSSVSSYDTGYRAVSLTLGKSSDSYGASGGSGSASVAANTSWSATTDASWITLGTKSGSGNGTLSYTVSANTLTSSRTGTITVTAGSGTSYPATKTIAVSQGAPAPTTYTVVFNANGGTGTMTSQTITYGVSTALKANTFTKSGYTFAGWSKTAGGSAVYGNGALVSNLVPAGGSITLYAVWAPVQNDFEIDNGVLKKYKGSGGAVTIPSSVTSIGYFAFEYCRSLTSVTIPSSVTSIGNSAFLYCSSLTSVTIPSSVTSIGISAFYGCSALTSVTIQEGVTSIGNYAFRNCSSLTSVTIPSSVTSIGDYAFYDCSSLASVTISEGVTSIGVQAFRGCKSLASITIPSSVTSIANSFCDCGLTSVTIAEGATSICENAFSGCSGLTSVTIPSSVKSIGYSAFANCGLHSVEIPEGVTSIDFGAFQGCSALASVAIPASVTSIGYDAFGRCGMLTSITLDSSNRYYCSIGGVLYNKDVTELVCCPGGARSVTIPSSVTSIGFYAFCGCSSLTSVSIPSSVTSIADLAFAYCSSLTSVTIPSSVTSIGRWAFDNCSDLKTVYVFSGDTERVRNLLESSGFSVEGVEFVEQVTTYTVSFNANGGLGTMTSQIITYGVGTALKANTFTKSGYTFAGWSKTAGGSVAYADGVSVFNLAPAGGSITLYAVWTPQVVAPSAPTSVSATDGSYADYARVTWSAASGATSYNLYRSTTTSRPSTATKTGVTSPYNDTTATPGTKYYYWIAAVNSAGSSVSSYDTGYRAVSLTLGKSSDSYTASGGSGSASVTANTSWSASANVSWITFGTKSGSGNGTLTYTVAANTSTSSRTGTITVTAGSGTSYPVSKTITVTQNAAPLNNNFSSATVISGNSGSTTGSNVGATAESGEPLLSSYSSATTTVWWKWTAPSSGSVRIDTVGSSFDTQMGIFTGSSLSSLTLVTKDDNSGATATSICTFDCTGGITYYICVGGYQGRTGTIKLNWSLTPSVEESDFEIVNGVLKKYKGSGGAVMIPSSVTSIGYEAFAWCNSLTSVTIPSSVTSISDGAFEYCRSLTSVTIPSSVTSIGSWAFSGCSSLTSVTIPSSVTSIGRNAFKDCSGLTSVTIPSSVTRIGDGTFEYCRSLTSVTIPSSVTSIGRNAFNGCIGLTSMTIPLGVTSIDFYAFYECSGLTDVTIPSSVTSIGSYAFEGCSALTSINIDSANRNYCSINGVLYNKDATELIRCPGGAKDVMMPSSVTSIGNYAFSDCRALTSVMISSSVTSIGSYAFSDCRALTSVTIPSNVMSISDGAFQDCRSLTSVTIPSSVTSIGRYAFNGCSGLTSMTIPSGVMSIGSCAFYECIGLTDVTIPSSVTSIGNEAFGCSGLKTVYVSSGDTERVRNLLESSGFSVEGVEFVEQVTTYTVSFNANGGSGTMTSQTITYGVNTSLKANTFTKSGYTFAGWSKTAGGSVAYADGASVSNLAPAGGSIILYAVWAPVQNDFEIVNGVLAEYKGAGGAVTIPSGVTCIGYGAFAWCSSLTSVTIPEGVTVIGQDAFRACISLTSVTIPESMTNIFGLAFAKCSSLTSVTIPSRVTSIGYGAFMYCDSLASIKVDVENSCYCSIDGVLYNKDVTELICCPGGLASLIIPSSVMSISEGAFDGCSSLTSVMIPLGVTNIDKVAFWGCSEITSVTIPACDVQLWDVFPDAYTKIKKVVLCDGSTHIGDYMFYSCSSLTSVTIPSSVTSIDDSAFTNCDKLATVYVEVGDVDRVRAMMLGKGVDVDKLTFVEIRKLIADVSALKEAFGEESSVVRNLTSEEELSKFNEFLGKCGITAASQISDKQKQYAYESFRMSAIMVEPQLFENEPKLNIHEFKQGEGGWSVSISLKAGEDEIAMARKALEEHISVGNKLTEITAKPNIVARPSEDGSSLTFTIAPPEGKQAFIMVR